MKCFLCFFAAFMGAVTIVSADGSGKTALEALEKQVADDPLGRVVQVVGVRGQHQPKEWRIVLSDPAKAGVFHLYTVQDKRVVKHEFVRKDYRDQLPGAAIPYKEVQIDSGQVFVIADRAAKEAKIGFDALNYELRCPELSLNPVWYVDLRDQRDAMVGRLFVSAKDGAVLRKIWFPQSDAPTQKGMKPNGAGGENGAAQVRAGNPPKDEDTTAPLRILRRGIARMSNPLRGGE